MELNADLHIHSRFAMATSPALSPETILAGCRRKGIDVIATGDALHPTWRKMWQEHLFDDPEIVVIPEAEVEDSARVHHVILAESLEQFEALQEAFTPYCTHLTTAGRPHLYADGETIAQISHEHGCLIGPAHAFTPWTSLFAAYKTPEDCYGEEPFDFCELGLSADSSYGAGIPGFQHVPFLSSSDAHSEYPEKLGREFTRLAVREPSAKAVLDAIKDSAVTLNAGFFPEEGKYNRTACIRCYTQFSYEEAERFHWKCPHDGGRIKLGVRERALAISTVPEEKRTPRPPYLKMIPLGEIIARVLSVSSPNTKKARALYERFIEAFGRETDVLLSAPYAEMAEISEDVAHAVLSMREGRVLLHPGGGGQYGGFEFL